MLFTTVAVLATALVPAATAAPLNTNATLAPRDEGTLSFEIYFNNRLGKDGKCDNSLGKLTVVGVRGLNAADARDAPCWAFRRDYWRTNDMYEASDFSLRYFESVYGGTGEEVEPGVKDYTGGTQRLELKPANNDQTAFKLEHMSDGKEVGVCYRGGEKQCTGQKVPCKWQDGRQWGYCNTFENV